MKFSQILIAMLVLSPAVVFADESARPAPVPNAERLDAWLFQKNRTYDEWFVNQKSVNLGDPYTWVYNESFANEFRMPAQWIDNELKGADAIAFRTRESDPMCGWNGKRSACRASYECVINVYFHQKRNPMPWDDSVRWTDFDYRATSVWVLSTLQPLDRREAESPFRKSPFTDPASGKSLLWWLVGIPGVSPIGGTAHLLAYDRSVFNNYSVIVQEIPCYEISGLELSTDWPFEKSRNIYRSIAFPKSWRDRIRPLAKEIIERDRTFFREKLKEMGVGK